jgi:two-component system sensor histidine kinase/response regulator
VLPLSARLAGVEGLDVPLALRAVNGQEPLLERVLSRYASTYQAGVPALVAHALAGEARACRAVCHSLRGASATVGATALVQQITAMEQALQDPSAATRWAPLAEPIDRHLRALAGALAQALR